MPQKKHFSHSHKSPHRRFNARPHFARGNFKRGNFSTGVHMHPSTFINKAVITEEAPHFVPEHRFADFLIDDSLKQAIVAKGYKDPTPIQDRAIPHILRGADVVGVANTGTGKTGAFLIPLIHKLLLNRNDRVLIMVPTRELALQIADELMASQKTCSSTRPGASAALP